MTSAGLDGAESAWERFEERLLGAVDELDEGIVGLEVAEGGKGAPFVVISVRTARLSATMPGDALLDRGLDDRRRATAVALGWREPEENPGGMLYSIEMARDEAPVLVSQVLGTLKQVFDVPHPDLVRSPWDTDVPKEDGEAPPVVATPRHPDDLVDLVRDALRRRDPGDHHPDADGDFIVVVQGLPLWVRVDPVEPIVTVFGYLVGDVANPAQARIEAGLLNERHELWTYVPNDDVISVRYQLPAMPFVDTQLLWVLEWLAAQLQDVARDTAVRVGGRVWWGAPAVDVTEETGP